MNTFSRLIGGFESVGIVDDQSAIEQYVPRQRQTVKQSDERFVLGKIWLNFVSNSVCIGQIILNAYGALADRTEMHDILAIEQSNIPLVNNLGSLIHWNFSQNAMIGDLRDGTLLNDLASKVFNYVTNIGFSLLPPGRVFTKPQFRLKGYRILFVLCTELPVLEDPCIANPVLGIPGANRVQMSKGMFQRCQATGKTYAWVFLPIGEEMLQFPEGVLVGHD